MIVIDKPKHVITEQEDATVQPKESLETNVINAIEETNIMEIRSKIHAFVSWYWWPWVHQQLSRKFVLLLELQNNDDNFFPLTDSLSIDYQFTFNLSKVDDKHLTAISFKNQPTKHDVDVDFSVKCVNKGGQLTNAKVCTWFIFSYNEMWNTSLKSHSFFSIYISLLSLNFSTNLPLLLFSSI